MIGDVSMINIQNELSNTLNFLNESQIQQLYNSLIDICKDINNIKVVGRGESSIVFEIDNQIIKISFIEYDNHPSLKEYVSKSDAILQPNFEYIVNLGEYSAKIIGTKKLSLDGITNEDVLNTYIKLRQDGYLWYDTKLENLGKDENGNCYLIDYGELIYINDLDPYHREKELRSHSIKKNELDSYYNNLNSENEIQKVF